MLGHALLVATPDRVCRAMPQMIFQQFPRDAPQRLLHRRDLRNDISAIAFFCHHPLQAAHLALNPAQPGEIGALDLRFDRQRFAFHSEIIPPPPIGPVFTGPFL